MKRVISLFLSVVMLISTIACVDLSAFAAGLRTGLCGESYYAFDTSTSTLTTKYNGGYVCKEHELSLIHEVSPNCINDGYREYICLVCGEIISETFPAIGHDYIGTVTEPTCTE